MPSRSRSLALPVTFSLLLLCALCAVGVQAADLVTVEEPLPPVAVEETTDPAAAGLCASAVLDDPLRFLPDPLAQSCTYTCVGTSPKLCPQFPGYAASCVGGCCTYTNCSIPCFPGEVCPSGGWCNQGCCVNSP